MVLVYKFTCFCMYQTFSFLTLLQQVKNIKSMNIKTDHLSGIRKSLKQNEEQLKKKAIKNDCLVIKGANQWIEEAKSRPIPKKLFGDLWFEKELCILYADTNVGKSILAVQIANSISSGESILNMNNEVSKQKILYIDCELSDKQFENRYSVDYKEHYTFDKNFIRAEINSDLEMPKEYKTLEEYLSFTLEKYAKEDEYKIFIIDNLSYLNSESEKAKYALLLMQKLKSFTRNYNCSVLVLAHTPKRDETKPISKNDLAGSKVLMNFCDSSFAIGFSSTTANYRYIKQIKQRNTEHIYHSDNIILRDVNKSYNFLQFNFLNYDSELNHLKTYGGLSKEDSDIQIIELIEKGLNNIEIGSKVGLTEGGVRKRRKKLRL